MFRFLVVKCIDSRTSSVEVYIGEEVVAEIFAREDGVRRLYLCNEASKKGLDWTAFLEVAPRITAMLDQADAEIAQVDAWDEERRRLDAADEAAEQD